jgi:hypothetical protein
VKFWLVLNRTLSNNGTIFLSTIFFCGNIFFIKHNIQISVTWKLYQMNERGTTMPLTNKKTLLKRNPSWKDKPRYGDDDTLRTFKWPYGTGQLIDELKHVRDILDIADKMQPSEVIRPIEVEMEFEECFIDSHGKLMMLMDRLIDSWNSRAMYDVISVPDNSVDSVSLAYKRANQLYQKTSDSILHMRDLYEQLKPETRSLITECSGSIQLERSMIAQKKEPAQTSPAGHVFRPACGFVFKAPLDTENRKSRG